MVLDSSNAQEFFATCPRQLESLLSQELRECGAIEVAEKPAGVAFRAPLRAAYKALINSRLANHILQPLVELPLNPDWDDYYKVLRGFEWQEYFEVNKTIAITVDSIGSPLQHDQFAAQRAKDAIADYFRAICGERPSVQVQRPDVAIHILLRKETLLISLNLSGESLHRRGYRLSQGEAPLKENLAAAVLMRAKWPQLASEGQPLVDPMCGSGTLLIEAALMAGKIAPGLYRDYYSAKGLKNFDQHLWQEVMQEAEQLREASWGKLPAITGYDADGRVIAYARDNIERAGLQDYISVEKRSLRECPVAEAAAGLVCVNPPYGERLGELDSLHLTYEELGNVVKRCFPGWQLSMFTGNPPLARFLKLSPAKVYKFFNGSIPCELWNCAIATAALRQERQEPRSKKPLSEGATMLQNRLFKKLKHLQKWAKRRNVRCYRLYDADLPEYAAAIDFYEDTYAVIQEYAPPKTIDAERARIRLQEIREVVKETLGLPAKQIFLKTRRRQKGKDQYQVLAQERKYIEVHEGPARLLVNFTDYLDTGLFLDSRIIRQEIMKRAQGKNFLNLFAYTGSATVFAALGGAKYTLTVDMSHTYLEWAKRNMELNRINMRAHRFEQADCLNWLRNSRESFDLILLDPPSFSNSKRMGTTLDIQRDHAELIDLAMARLQRDGTLIFVTNKQKFKLDPHVSTTYRVTDITSETLPEDFSNSGTIHRAYLIIK